MVPSENGPLMQIAETLSTDALRCQSSRTMLGWSSHIEVPLLCWGLQPQCWECTVRKFTFPIPGWIEDKLSAYLDTFVQEVFQCDSDESLCRVALLAQTDGQHGLRVRRANLRWVPYQRKVWMKGGRSIVPWSFSSPASSSRSRHPPNRSQHPPKSKHWFHSSNLYQMPCKQREQVQAVQRRLAITVDALRDRQNTLLVQG